MPKRRKTISELAESGTLARNSGRYTGRIAAATAAAKPLGRPPAHLPPAESAVWRELIKLTPAGHLQSSDRFFVEVACRLITRMRAGDVKPSELNAVMNVLSKLGLNPLDRTKLNLLPPRNHSDKSEEDKRWAELD